MKTMKKFIIAAALLLAGFATASAQKIKGSDTVLPLSQKEAEEYMKVNPSATVTVTGGGSGVPGRVCSRCAAARGETACPW